MSRKHNRLKRKHAARHCGDLMGQSLRSVAGAVAAMDKRNGFILEVSRNCVDVSAICMLKVQPPNNGMNFRASRYLFGVFHYVANSGMSATHDDDKPLFSPVNKCGIVKNFILYRGTQPHD